MKPQTKANIERAFEVCESRGHSLEYSIQFAMDYAKVDHGCVMNYLQKEHNEANGL